MARIPALILDRANAAVVHWRVGRRQPQVDTEAIDAYLADPPEPLFPGPTSLPPLDPLVVGAPGSAGAGGFRRSLLAGGRRREWRAPLPGVPPLSGADWRATELTREGGGVGERPAVILLHGWLATRWHLLVYRGLARGLVQHGIDVWMPRLPHHVERTRPGAVSGARCVSADLVMTAESLRQAVTESRALARWLRQRGAPWVGIWGISLGGWVAALAATTEPAWDLVALWEPVLDPVATLRWSPLLADVRGTLAAAGVRPERGEEVLRRFSPVHRSPRTAAERMLLVVGRYDNVVPPKSVRALTAAWGIEARWLQHGHISLIASTAARRATVRFVVEARAPGLGPGHGA